MAEEWDRRKLIVSRYHMRDVQHKIDSEYQVTNGRSVQGGQNRKQPDRKALSKLPAINKDERNVRNIQPKIGMQKERLKRPQFLPRLSMTERRGQSQGKAGKLSTDQKNMSPPSRVAPPGDAGKLRKRVNVKSSRRQFSINPESYENIDTALKKERRSLQEDTTSLHGLGARSPVEPSRGTTITSTRLAIDSSDRLQGPANQNPNRNEELVMQENLNGENLPSVPEVPPIHLERYVGSRRAQMSNTSDEHNEEMRRAGSLNVWTTHYPLMNAHLQDSEEEASIASEISDHSLENIVGSSWYSMRNIREGTPIGSRLRHNIISGQTSPTGPQDIIRTTSGVTDMSPSNSLSTSEDSLEEDEWPGVHAVEVQHLEGIREPLPREPEGINHQGALTPAVTNNISHDPPLSTSRSSPEGREQSLPLNDPFYILPFFAPLGLTPTPTAPNIQTLQENLDLIATTLPPIRHRRRTVGRTTAIEEKKVAEKPKADPERLRKIQESLLQEDLEEDGDTCRICLTRGDTADNHLVSPCQCTGSLKYVHQECLKRWLISKIQSGAELDAVKTCEMCRQNVEPAIEGFDIHEQYRQHHRSERSTMHPSLYLVLLLHLYQQRYEELLRLTRTRNQVSEISRRLSHLRTGRTENSSDSAQDS
ncbi:probable E3 ubiquitin-protein ligase MARCH10 isoform X2 [Xenopus tropicalis]|uniref:RING-type E3 ubiquitin transferase n=1 Tax=Xenopus tropicalis TaxID=8364 RepID=A0A803K738_XENTR|nr:probable E3 ubiquitin-protein ligase MARCH10 isoform X2 [Xenopus tropicalis]